MPTTSVNCPACCSGCAKQCFQIYTATYTCASLSWSGPTAGAKVCLDATTPTAWTKVSGSPFSCGYQIYWPLGHCCTVDGDCSGFTAAPPDLPFGGLAPTDCCICTVDCVSNPDLTCCVFHADGLDDAETPDTIDWIVGGAVGSLKIETDGGGNSWQVDAGGMGGLAIHSVRNGTGPGGPAGTICEYVGSAVATGLVKIMFTPAGGGPAVNILDAVQVELRYTPGPGACPSLTFYSSGNVVESGDCTTGPLCGPPDNLVSLFCSTGPTISNSFSSCCKPFTCNFAGPPPAISDPGPWNTAYVTSISAVPC